MTSELKVPTVGIVSLGCPKAGSDTERILTKLRAEGYNLSPNYDDADLVIVNTCGFIDAAVEESLDAIGEALSENGKVIVTGCLGAKGDIVQTTHPSVLAVTGPHAADEVMGYVHQHLPKPHDPYTARWCRARSAMCWPRLKTLLALASRNCWSSRRTPPPTASM